MEVHIPRPLGADMKTVAVLLVLVLTLSVRGLAAPTPESQTAKVKAEIEKRHASNHANITLTMKDGRKVKGRILGVHQDSFDFYDRSTGNASTITFSDVKKVGGVGMSKGAKIGLLVLGGLLAANAALGPQL
jgi:hypothetical protein